MKNFSGISNLNSAESKFLFRKDYDSNIWVLAGKGNEDIMDDGEYQYTWAYLSDEQAKKAYRSDGFIESGYGYIMLKYNKVRQIRL